MSDKKLGINAAGNDKRVEELEDVLKRIMYFIDKWLEGAEFELDEATRAAIMHDKVTRKIADLEHDLSHSERIASAAYYLLGQIVEE